MATKMKAIKRMITVAVTIGWMKTEDREFTGYVFSEDFVVYKKGREWQLALWDDGKVISVTRRYTAQLFSGVYKTKKQAEKAIANVKALDLTLPKSEHAVDLMKQEIGEDGVKAWLEAFYGALNAAHHS